MKPLATLLLILLPIFPATTFAQDSPSSATPADKCSGLPRACSAAAAELKAARELIAGYEAYIAAANQRIEITERQIRALKEKGELESERARELEKVIAAEQAAKSSLLKLKEELSKRVANLERQLSRSKKFALIAGVAAGVAILIGASK